MAAALRLALFDCDGTLVDGQYAIAAAMTAAWESCGLAAPSRDAVRDVIGLPLLDAIRRLGPGFDASLCTRLSGLYKDFFAAGRLRDMALEPIFPGIREALETLQSTDVLMGVATGKSRRGLTAVLAHHGLAEFFVTLKTADDGPGKPNPDMVLQACAETGVEPAQVVVIGDTTYDMAMAMNAGAVPIGVAWGYHAATALRQAGARTVIPTQTRLAACVLEAFPGGG